MSPRPIPPSAELDEAECLGWEEFTAGQALAATWADNAPAPFSGTGRGWWLAYARHYAEGFAFVVAAQSYDAVQYAVNPYPQFSPAWEAWAAGFEAAANED